MALVSKFIKWIDDLQEPYREAEQKQRNDKEKAYLEHLKSSLKSYKSSKLVSLENLRFTLFRLSKEREYKSDSYIISSDPTLGINCKIDYFEMGILPPVCLKNGFDEEKIIASKIENEYQNEKNLSRKINLFLMVAIIVFVGYVLVILKEK